MRWVALAERFSGLAGAGGPAHQVTHLTGHGKEASFSYWLVSGRRPVPFHTAFSIRFT